MLAAFIVVQAGTRERYGLVQSFWLRRAFHNSIDEDIKKELGIAGLCYVRLVSFGF